MTGDKMQKIFSNDLLQEMADKLKEAGIDVYYSVWNHSQSKPTYFNFTDGVNIGYCQEKYGGLSFSTVHKPCKQCGTGFGITGNDVLYSASLQEAKKAFIIAPNWATQADRAAVKKYAKWEEYEAKNNYCKYVKY